MDSVFHIVQRQLVYGWDTLQDIINVPHRQRRLIMVIVCVALLLDNMLYMVIVSFSTKKQVLLTFILILFFTNKQKLGSYYSGLFTKYRSMVINSE